MKKPGRKTNTSRDAVVRAMAAAGRSQGEIAKHLLIAPSGVHRIAKRLGLRLRDARGDYSLGTHDQARADAMGARYRAGETLQQIGDSYGLTRERVRQILRQRTPVLAADGGQAVVVAQRKRERATKLDQKYMARLGCGWAEYKRMLKVGRELAQAGAPPCKSPLRAFLTQKGSASNRRISWELSFWEWWSIWQASGRWDQRGRGQGYVMCRRNDEGPYSSGNVFIATAIENTSSGKHKKSGLPTDVAATKSGRFTAHRFLDGRQRGLGTFDTPAQAYAAYVAAAPGYRHRSPSQSAEQSA